MTTRTIRSTVQFDHSFALADTDGPWPAGRYEVETDEETIDDLSFGAWRRVATTLYLTDKARGHAESVRIDPAVLEAAVQADAALSALAQPVTNAVAVMDDIRTRGKPTWFGLFTPRMVIAVAIALAVIGVFILGLFN